MACHQPSGVPALRSARSCGARCPAADDGVAAGEAQRFQLLPQPGGVVAPLGPAALQVVAVGVEHATAPRFLPGRHDTGAKPMSQCLAIGTELAGDRAQRGSRCVQACSLVEPTLPPLACRDTSAPCSARMGSRSHRWSAGHPRLLHYLQGDPAHRRMVALNRGMNGVAEVAQQVPPVGDLYRIGRTLPDAVGVDAGPVAGDHRHAGIGLQPRRQALGAAVGQQVDHPVALEVDQHRPVPVAATPSPIRQPPAPAPAASAAEQRRGGAPSGAGCRR